MSHLDQSRIAKNTGFLYIRMLLIILVQFFTIRITIKYLGVEDYGIYNVVCGVSNLITFLTHTMNSASQRFFSYELGTDNKSQLRKTFSTFVVLFVFLGILSIIVLGVIGYWLINTHLEIPDERLNAALFAFYITLLTLFLTFASLPFNSLIIAHEDMKTFAFVSIVDAVLKLLIAYCLIITVFDKLEFYAVLIFLSTLIPSLLYIIYCRKNYEEVSLSHYSIDWTIAKKIIPFMSWSLVGGFSWTVCTHGLSIVINMFFGPIANAAKAIADKINGAIISFSNNFMMASQPQIVKTFAAHDYRSMHKAVFLETNIALYLLLIFAVPIICNTNFILTLWLDDHTTITTRMVQLILFFSIQTAFETPINQAIRATGRIKYYEIVTGIINMLVIPFSCFFFMAGYAAFYAQVSLIISYSMSFLIRPVFLKKYIFITYSSYFKNVVQRNILCIVFIALSNVLLYEYMAYGTIMEKIVRFLMSIIISLASVLILGIKKNERSVIIKKLKNYNQQ